MREHCGIIPQHRPGAHRRRIPAAQGLDRQQIARRRKHRRFGNRWSPRQYFEDEFTADRLGKDVAGTLQISFFLPLRLTAAREHIHRAIGQAAANLLQKADGFDAGEISIDGDQVQHAPRDPRDVIRPFGLGHHAKCFGRQQRAERGGEFRLRGNDAKGLHVANSTARL